MQNNGNSSCICGIVKFKPSTKLKKGHFLLKFENCHCFSRLLCLADWNPVHMLQQTRGKFVKRITIMKEIIISPQEELNQLQAVCACSQGMSLSLDNETYLKIITTKTYRVNRRLKLSAGEILLSTGLVPPTTCGSYVIQENNTMTT